MDYRGVKVNSRYRIGTASLRERCRIRKGGGRVGLRELRDARVLSQQELAVQSGVSKTTIVNIEAGRIRPHPATLRKLAAALGLEPGALAAALRRSEAEGPELERAA